MNAPIGILRDGEKLIVTYHGGADKDIVAQEKQIVHAKNPMGNSAFPGTIPEGSIETNSTSKYDGNAFDDDALGDGIIFQKKSILFFFNFEGFKTGKPVIKGIYEEDDDTFIKSTLAKSKISGGKVKTPQKSTIDSGEYDFNKPPVKKSIESSKIASTKGQGGLEYSKKFASTSSISSMGSFDDDDDLTSLKAHGNSHRIKPQPSAYGNFDEDTYNASSKPVKSNSMNADRSIKEHLSSRSDSKPRFLFFLTNNKIP